MTQFRSPLGSTFRNMICLSKKTRVDGDVANNYYIHEGNCLYSEGAYVNMRYLKWHTSNYFNMSGFKYRRRPRLPKSIFPVTDSIKDEVCIEIKTSIKNFGNLNTIKRRRKR